MTTNSSADIARCRAEIAEIEAKLRAGHPDIAGLALALRDWSTELRMVTPWTRAPENGELFAEPTP
jgi:hypothetical protein